MYFFKNTAGNWIIGPEPTSLKSKVASELRRDAPTVVTVRTIETRVLLIDKMEVTTIKKNAEGDFYASYAEFLTAVSDFFDNAPITAEEVDAKIGAEVDTLSDRIDTVEGIANAASSGSLGSIKPTDAAPTPARNGNYTFSIGGNKPAWLTAEAGVTTVKAGDGVSVVYTAPSGYTYTHVNMSSDFALKTDVIKINETQTERLKYKNIEVANRKITYITELIDIRATISGSSSTSWSNYSYWSESVSKTNMIVDAVGIHLFSLSALTGDLRLKLFINSKLISDITVLNANLVNSLLANQIQKIDLGKRIAIEIGDVITIGYGSSNSEKIQLVQCTASVNSSFPFGLNKWRGDAVDNVVINATVPPTLTSGVFYIPFYLYSYKVDDLSNPLQYAKEADLQIVNAKTQYENYIELTSTEELGLILVTNGTLNTSGGANYVHKIFNVTAGKPYRVSCANNSIANDIYAYIAFYNGTTYISSVVRSVIGATPYTDYLVVAPTTATIMKVASWVNSATTAKEVLYKNVPQLKEYLDKSIVDDSFEISNLQRRILKAEKGNDFAWGTFDKAIFAFTIDDANSYLEGVYQLFHSKGIPLCASVPAANLFDIHNGVVIKDTLDKIIDDNGEVLSHSLSLITADSPESDYVYIFKTTKQILENEGYDVRGIILSGGTGYIYGTDKLEKYCRKYYDYSDKYGISTQYAQNRIAMWDYTTVAAFKSKLDLCCASPGFYPVALHGSGTIENVTDLGSIVDYILAKGNSVAIISNWTDTFDNYGTTKFENRLKALEP